MDSKGAHADKEINKSVIGTATKFFICLLHLSHTFQLAIFFPPRMHHGQKMVAWNLSVSQAKVNKAKRMRTARTGILISLFSVKGENALNRGSNRIRDKNVHPQRPF
jgi:hypothetical protein